MTDAALTFQPVAKRADLAAGSAMRVVAGGREIALFNLDGAIYATDDLCTHAEASLSEGFIEGGSIECPLHNGMFDIRTGKAIRAPCVVDLRTYPVKVEGEHILIGVPG